MTGANSKNAGQGLDLEAVISVVSRYWPKTEAIYLFGSYAQDEPWPRSDVDLALLLPPEVARRERGIALHDGRFALESSLKREVDLVNLRLVSTVFQNEIIHSGRCIFTANEEVALAFEMKVLSAYQKLNEERREILKSFFETKRAYAI